MKKTPPSVKLISLPQCRNIIIFKTWVSYSILGHSKEVYIVFLDQLAQEWWASNVWKVQKASVLLSKIHCYLTDHIFINLEEMIYRICSFGTTRLSGHSTGWGLKNSPPIVQEKVRFSKFATLYGIYQGDLELHGVTG